MSGFSFRYLREYLFFIRKPIVALLQSERQWNTNNGRFQIVSALFVYTTTD